MLQNMSKNEFKAHDKSMLIRKALYKINDYIDVTNASIKTFLILFDEFNV